MLYGKRNFAGEIQELLRCMKPKGAILNATEIPTYRNKL